MTSKITVSAPGKIIVTGEHSVVYGYPALVSTVNRFLTLSIQCDLHDAERIFFKSILENLGTRKPSDVINEISAYKSGHFQFSIASDIPIGSGMGSSAALAVALTYLSLYMVNNRIPQKKQVNKIALAIEKQTHQNPSGVDNTVITHGGSIIFQKTSQGPLFSPIHINLENNWWLVQTGQPTESTGQMVSLVKQSYDRNTAMMHGLLKKVGEISETIIDLLQERDFHSDQMIDSLKKNNDLLYQIGVVSDSTALVIGKIESNGGAAKISGAGGKDKNSGLLLVYHQDENFIKEFCSANKLGYFPVRTTDIGVSSIIL